MQTTEMHASKQISELQSFHFLFTCPNQPSACFCSAPEWRGKSRKLIMCFIDIIRNSSISFPAFYHACLCSRLNIRKQLLQGNLMLAWLVQQIVLLCFTPMFFIYPQIPRGSCLSSPIQIHPAMNEVLFLHPCLSPHTHSIWPWNLADNPILCKIQFIVPIWCPHNLSPALVYSFIFNPLTKPSTHVATTSSRLLSTLLKFLPNLKSSSFTGCISSLIISL